MALESGLRLENLDRPWLVLASGKLVLQKYNDLGFLYFFYSINERSKTNRFIDGDKTEESLNELFFTCTLEVKLVCVRGVQQPPLGAKFK